MARRIKIRFLTDEDVPDSVGVALTQRGHLVRRVRDEMLTGSPDKVVAAAARENDHVLITHNYRDFRREVRERLASTNAKVDRLCRVELECGQPLAAQRVMEEIRHRARICRTEARGSGRHSDQHYKNGLSRRALSRGYLRTAKKPRRVRAGLGIGTGSVDGRGVTRRFKLMTRGQGERSCVCKRILSPCAMQVICAPTGV